MTFDNLLDFFQQDPRTQNILTALSDTPANIHLQHLRGSGAAFVAQAVFKKTRTPHVFILPNAEEAAYFQNDLKALLPSKDVFFFPDSFKKKGLFLELNQANIQLRTETINRITNPTSKAELVVTYPEAIFEKVVKKQVLKKNMIQMKVGESLDVDFMIELFVEYGFERTDFVYEPGQFSIRGDIVDVFSFANRFPYRIELFDDEVESIRLFDPVSQLSQKKIERITIIPNVQTHFDENEKESFFKALTPKTVLWFKDGKNILQEVEKSMESVLEARKEIVGNMDYEEHPLYTYLPEDLFVSAGEITKQIQHHSTIEIGKKPLFDPSMLLLYNQKAQTSFNRNFDLLIEELKKNEKEKKLSFLFAENKKQIERFYSIFQDLGEELSFIPINQEISAGFIDNDIRVSVYTDHQIFNRYYKYKIKQGFSSDQALMIKTLRELQPGDFVTHIDHGVGRYSGLEKTEVNGKVQEMVRIVYANNDLLYVGINTLHKIAKFSGKEGQTPRLNKLGSDTWSNLKRRTKRKIKDIAEELIKLYAKRKAAKGFACEEDNYLQNELEASFIYEDTPDQEKATTDVKKDMMSETPMDRLVCGDVGFGKTEVAIRAAFKAVCNGKQVAVLVPTTILAFQHYETFSKRLEDFPVSIDYVNRFRSSAEKNAIYNRLNEGKIDILIGTHSIVGKKVQFKNLGLLVVDEEQKFGVSVKEKLKKIKVNVDTLALTATPIPRTLQFSLMAARDLSIIQTPPPNRQPVVTEVHPFNPEIIKEAVEYEVYRGGQVFFVHNRVKDLVELKEMLRKYLPDVEAAVAHGQLSGHELETVMRDFIHRKFDVLLCTNIIETGLDIPNANTIIVNNAHMFGLSDLHQLRGRVGRSNTKAFCYLFSPPMSTLTKEARLRLKTIEEFSDLGSGFNIAMRDLNIRGAGNLLGAEQSGFISEIGFETYHKILDEAIQELKETTFKDLYSEELKTKKTYAQESQIDTDLEIHIPDNYVNTISERMSLYTQLNNISNQEELLAFSNNMQDRFGSIPPPVEELFNAIRLKWLTKSLGIERLILKKDKLTCYFVQNQEAAFYRSEVFSNILKYVQQDSEHCRLKQTDSYLMLFILQVDSMKTAWEKLKEIESFAYQTNRPEIV